VEKRTYGMLPCKIFGRKSMPIQRRATEVGIFDAAELALLGRVFDRLVEQDHSPEARDAMASRIIANYMAGVVDEDELVSLSKQPLGR
jgi:hypothetical protein